MVLPINVFSLFFQNAIRDQFSIYGGAASYAYPYGSKPINYLKKYYNKYPYPKYY